MRYSLFNNLSFKYLMLLLVFVVNIISIILFARSAMVVLLAVEALILQCPMTNALSFIRRS